MQGFHCTFIPCLCLSFLAFIVNCNWTVRVSAYARIDCMFYSDMEGEFCGFHSCPLYNKMFGLTHV